MEKWCYHTCLQHLSRNVSCVTFVTRTKPQLKINYKDKFWKTMKRSLTKTELKNRPLLEMIIEAKMSRYSNSRKVSQKLLGSHFDAFNKRFHKDMSKIVQIKAYPRSESFRLKFCRVNVTLRGFCQCCFPRQNFKWVKIYFDLYDIFEIC